MGNAQPKISVEEQMKLHKTQLRKAIRELDREKNHLAMQEKKTITEMKKLGKQGQIATVKIMAKDLVRVRKHQSKFLTMKAQLQGVQMQLQTMKSSQAMTNAMQGVTKVMVQMNKNMDATAVQKIMHEFMTENERQQMTQEVLGDAMDEALEDDEGAEGEVVDQILEEIGIEATGELAKVGVGSKLPTGAQTTGTAAAAPAVEEDDLEKRLNALKGP